MPASKATIAIILVKNHVAWLVYRIAHWIGALWMHRSYWYEGLSQVKVRIITTAIFCWSIFAIHFFVCFCFVLCIHLVPSCNSLLMFVSNFAVYLIIILMYLWIFYLFTYLFCQYKLGLLICLFIIYLWIYTVSKNSDFVIYLSTYLFVLFIYIIVLYLFTHNLYIFY